MIKPLVSVIIPTMNRSKVLVRAVNSVLSQTYANLECIIVDGKSTDDTREIISSIHDQRLVFHVQTDNRNFSAAMNEGISLAKGDYVAFLDDDDEWLPEKLEKQMNLLLSSPAGTGMVYCWYNSYDDLKNEKIFGFHPTLRGNIFSDILEKEGICGTPTLLLKKEVFSKAGAFNEKVTFGDDGEFACRVAKHFDIDFVPEVLVKVHLYHIYRSADYMAGRQRSVEAINTFNIMLEEVQE